MSEGDAVTARGESRHRGPPADPVGRAALARFPARDLEGDWFRSHVDRDAADRGCWWFASVTGPPAAAGRFDLAAPYGTCYLGSSEEVAARERVGPQLRTLPTGQSVTAGVLTSAGAAVLVSRVRLPRTRAANLAVRAAQRWVDRSLWSGTGIYDVTQAWARELHAADFAGVVYPPRFTLARRARALGVFGDAGRASPARAVASSRPLAEVLTDLGVRVVPPPPSPAEVLPADAPPPPL